jgi:ABC-type multidrug transport system fused ATPase/permease subunit
MKKSLSELTTEELRSKQKSLKMSFGLLIGMMIILVASLITLMALKGSRSVVISLSVMPLVFIPILISSKKMLKDVEAEINVRNPASR